MLETNVSANKFSNPPGIAMTFFPTVTPLLSSIKEQKENLISIITDAQKVEESLTTEQEVPADRQQEIQSLLDQFTKTTGELGQQLSIAGKLFAENDISI